MKDNKVTRTAKKQKKANTKNIKNSRKAVNRKCNMDEREITEVDNCDSKNIVKYANADETTQERSEITGVGKSTKDQNDSSYQRNFAQIVKEREEYMTESADVNFADTVDQYGKGSPTDRLQFGYAPANADEAVAFHSTISPHDWITQRRRNGRVVYCQKQKLDYSNCEPITCVLKLKAHWSKLAEFNSEIQNSDTRLSDPDNILNMLAAKQRVQ